MPGLGPVRTLSAADPEPAPVEPVEIVERIADESHPSYEVVRTKDGHRVRVPKGYPLERRGGVIDLYATEEFLLERIDEALDKIEALEERVKKLEENTDEKEEKEERKQRLFYAGGASLED